MTFDDAKISLSFHCGANPNIDDPRWEAGFLQMLRHYRGLKRETYQSLIDCVEAVADHLKTAPTLDRSVVNSLWGICHFSRVWAIEPEGMLQRNRLISPEDVQQLKEWIDDLSFRISMWLDGNDI